MQVSGFSDVDRSAEPGRMVDYLDLTAASMKAAKDRLGAILDLPDGARCLDIGCGVGHDVVAMGERLAAVGVDRSTTLLDEGRRRWPAISLVQARAEALPFASGSFAGCRIERVLQHVPDPDKVVASAWRLLARGGRIAVFEPDWSTFVFADDDPDLFRAFADAAASRTASGTVGRELPAILQRVGFADVGCEPSHGIVRSIGGLRALCSVDAVLDRAVVLGLLSPDGARAWLADVERRSAEGTLWGYFLRLFAWGTKP